jgi:sugar phosphate isomerase/epimerase
MTVTRRQFGALLAAARAFGSPGQFRLALCNKTFEGKPFPVMCRLTRATGFTGMEIAPYTLANDPAALPPSRVVELRSAMASEGVSYVGLHSVLNAPKGMSVSTADREVRHRSCGITSGV